MHEGHRKRIIERLDDGSGLNDHELLEILLFSAIPRVNTNPIAHDLLEHFGSLKGVLAAELSQLSSVEGVGSNTAAYLKCVGLIYDRVRFETEPYPNIKNFADTATFLRERYRGLVHEQLEIFCMNANGKIRYAKRFTSHEDKRASTKPEDVTRFLAAHGARGLIVAHNHIASPARPSVQDDAFTAQLLAFCSINNIAFHDHVIVSRDECYSYRLEHRLEMLAKEFDVAKLVEERFR